MEQKLPSGAILDITVLDFEKAFAVFQVVSRQIGLLDFDAAKIDFQNFKATDLLEFKKPLTQALSNSDFSKVGNQCLEKCTYNGLKVTAQTWNDLKARNDYLFAVFYALKENCYPYIEGAFSDSAE